MGSFHLKSPKHGKKFSNDGSSDLKPKHSKKRANDDAQDFQKTGGDGSNKRIKGSESSNGQFREKKEGYSGRPSQTELERKQAILLKQREKLPIWNWGPDIRIALRKYGHVLILVGETGSGKSTQVPQFLLKSETKYWLKPQEVTVKGEDGEKKTITVGGLIGITEPRRVAATSLAHRVAAESGSFLGEVKDMKNTDLVGYAVRFENRMPKGAKIKYMTEGMLLQELLRDKHLIKYSCIVIDEVHERSTDVDLILGFLREMVANKFKGRGGIPLKVIIMSATANVNKLYTFWTTPLASEEREAALKEAGKMDSNVTSADEMAIDDDEDDEDERAVRKSRSASTNSNASAASAATLYSEFAGFSDDEGKTPSDGKVELMKKAAESYDATPLTDKEFEVVDKKNRIRMKPMSLMKGHDNVVVLHIEGRQHHVDIRYTFKPVDDVVEASFKTVFQIHTQEPMPGDVLVFLTGQDEIKSLKERIDLHTPMLSKEMPHLEVVELFGQMSIEQQQLAFERPKTKNTRKVILATNIAETSVTVPGVRYVVDAGRAKIKEFRPHLGLASLLPKPISKSSALQRMGRAGREAAGKVWRLYTQDQFTALPDQDRPEILRSDVVEAVLKMKARGIKDIFTFPLMDAPPRDTMMRALQHLFNIGALDQHGDINAVGLQMAKFPLSPNYARVLVAAAEPVNDVLLEAVDAIAVLSGDDIFKQAQSEEEREAAEESRKDLLRREGDILTQLTAMQRYMAETGNRQKFCERHLMNGKNMKTAADVRRQLRQACVEAKLITKEAIAESQLESSDFVPMDPERAETLLKCFLTAFNGKTAIMDGDGTYKTIQGKHRVVIHPSSVLHGKKKEGIMFLEHVYTNKNYAKKVSGVQLDWVFESMAAGLE